MYEKFKNLTTDRTVKALIGISREQFDTIVPYFAAAYAEIQQERYERKEIKRIPSGGRTFWW